MRFQLRIKGRPLFEKPVKCDLIAGGSKINMKVIVLRQRGPNPLRTQRDKSGRRVEREEVGRKEMFLRR